MPPEPAGFGFRFVIHCNADQRTRNARGVQRHLRRCKMRHRNPRMTKKEVVGTMFKFGQFILRIIND